MHIEGHNTSPLYTYPDLMFMVTASTVVIWENGVYMIRNDEYACDTYRFPTTKVKAGQESIQFAAVRAIKQDLGIFITMNELKPIDYRSEPSRSVGGNVIDIGFACMLEKQPEVDISGKWVEVDFENKKTIKDIDFYMDHNILLERALDIALIFKE